MLFIIYSQSPVEELPVKTLTILLTILHILNSFEKHFLYVERGVR